MCSKYCINIISKHLDLYFSANYGRPHEFNQRKGLWEGEVLVDDVPITGYTIYPMEFKSQWVQGWASQLNEQAKP